MRLTNIPKITRSSSTLTRLIALLSLILAVGLVIAQPVRMQETTPGFIADGEAPPYVNGVVCIQLEPGIDLATTAAQHGLNPVPLDVITHPDPLAQPNYLLQITDGATPAQKAAELRADVVRIAYADPNFFHGAPEAARPTWSVGDSYAFVAVGRKSINTQWAKSMIRLDEAHQVTRGATASGAPVVVAVLDTGIDLNHPAFAGRLVPGYDFVDNDNDPSEEGDPRLGPYGHGTHVAGLIAMVAPDAKIMPIRVLNVAGRGDFWSLGQAINWAVDHGANVINLSLSTPNRSMLINEVFYQRLDPDIPPPSPFGPGVVVVVAAGNSGTSVYQYPAAESSINGNRIKEVLSVSATNSSDVLSSFSTFGTWVSVAAPGERIVSPVPHNKYGTWSGTSMASPIVAGEAALVRAAFPALEADDVVDQINSALTTIGPNRRIDIARAVTVPPDDRHSLRSSRR